MKPGGIRLKIMKIMLMTAVVWSAVFLLAAELPLLEAKALDFWVNVFELACGLASGTLLILFARPSHNGFIITGTALAIFAGPLASFTGFLSRPSREKSSHTLLSAIWVLREHIFY